jgi:hypothetical protein
VYNSNRRPPAYLYKFPVLSSAQQEMQRPLCLDIQTPRLRAAKVTFCLPTSIGKLLSLTPFFSPPRGNY